MSYHPDGTLNEVAAATDRLRAAVEDREGAPSDLIAVITTRSEELVSAIDAYMEHAHGKDTQDVRIETALEAIQHRPQAPSFPGVAYWGRNPSAGVCQGCQQGTAVYQGYNGGASTGVAACVRCIRDARG